MVSARKWIGLFGFEHDEHARIATRHRNPWRVTDAPRGRTRCSAWREDVEIRSLSDSDQRTLKELIEPHR
jgi:hypothetical protein